MLKEAEILAAHARDHIHRWGNSSSFFKKYFGAAGTAEPAGWYDKIVHAHKAGYIFRCDDPDGNCANNESACVKTLRESDDDCTDLCGSVGWSLARRERHG